MSPGPEGPGTRDLPGTRAVRGFLDVLLPPACVCCGRGLEAPEAPVCGLCWHRLPRMAPPLCPRCGCSRPVGLPGGCPECEAWPGPWRAAAPYRMEGRARRLVHALKYGRWTKLAGPMGRAMEPAARALAAGVDEAGPPVLVPVPLSGARRRERGFNQARLLAEGLAAATGWRVAERLERVRTGRRQARLGRRGRAENVMALFRSRAAAPGGQTGRPRKRPGDEAAPGSAAGVGAGPGTRSAPALLVDDVLTTGATAGACLRALREGGTRPVGVVTFARALHSFGGP